MNQIALHQSSLGRPTTWARDLGIVGGVSSFLAITCVAGFDMGATYVALASIAGALSGIGIGLIVRRILSGRLARVAIYKLLGLGVVVGAAWGASVGTVAGLVFTGSHRPFGGGFEMMLLSMAVAAAAGAIQFGWFWLPYTARIAKGRTTWPVVVGAALLGPVIGWAGIFTVGVLSALANV